MQSHVLTLAEATNMKLMKVLLILMVSCFSFANNKKCRLSEVHNKKFTKVQDKIISGIYGTSDDFYIQYGLYEKGAFKNINSFVHIYKCIGGNLVVEKKFDFKIRKMHLVKKRSNHLEVIFADETTLVGDIVWLQKERKYLFKAYVDEEM